MRKIYLTLIAFCMLHSVLIAQNLQNGTQTTWTVYTTDINTPFAESTDRQRKNSILYVSESEAIMPFNEPKGAQQIVVSLKNDLHGVVKVNN